MVDIKVETLENKREIREPIMLKKSKPKQLGIIMLTALLCALLLGACGGDQSASQIQPTLPAADEVKIVPSPTPTQIPTPTAEVVALVKKSVGAGSPFRRGEPASLVQVQDDLATLAAQYGGRKDNLPTPGTIGPFKPTPSKAGTATTTVATPITPTIPPQPTATPAPPAKTSVGSN
jgi:hypothetical protein